MKGVMRKQEERQEDVTWRSLQKEREYGIYWYSALWRVLRPVLIGTTVAVIVIGLGMSLWNRLYDDYAGPVDAADGTEVLFEIASGQSLAGQLGDLLGGDLLHVLFLRIPDFLDCHYTTTRFLELQYSFSNFLGFFS